MNFDQTPEFKKELKHFAKKWRSLPLDIVAVQRDIVPLYIQRDGVDLQVLRKGFFSGKRATILRTMDDGREVIKMRLDVESLESSDKVRIVFVAVKTDANIVFIELFAKNEKPRENQKRIDNYLK